MRVTIASTPVVDRVGECLMARRWEGVSEGGIPVLALILAISPQSHDPAVAARFAAEFHQLPADPRAGLIDEPAEEVDRARVAPLAPRSCGRSAPTWRASRRTATTCLSC